MTISVTVLLECTPVYICSSLCVMWHAAMNCIGERREEELGRIDQNSSGIKK